MMLRYFLIYFINFVIICRAARRWQSYSTPGNSGLSGVVRSTIEGVWEVRIRDYVGQIPIGPPTGLEGHQFGYPQKLSFVVQELDQNNELLRESICYYEITEPKEVIGDTFRCVVLSKRTFYGEGSSWSVEKRRAYLDDFASDKTKKMFELDKSIYAEAESLRQNMERLRRGGNLDEYYSYGVTINKFTSLAYLSLQLRPITATKGTQNSRSKPFFARDSELGIAYLGGYIRFLNKGEETRGSDDYQTFVKWKS